MVTRDPVLVLNGQEPGIFYMTIQEERTMTVWEELKARGLIAQVTDEDEIKEMVNNGKATFYIGFDPTADSLHVGHFMALCLMKRLQMAGNRPIALLGGGTGMIGDPSGRTDMRQMLTKETIQHNIDCFKQQMSRFIDFSDGKALMVNNADWLMNLNYVELLREVGAHFSVNRMLTAECYKQRMERGLSFLEFNYMIMQSYDFYMLYQKYGCNMQFGGDDQWSNMLGGTELIRRKLGKDAYAMTITLLLNSEGKKMGKTQSGAVWLDPNKTSPFDFYQYWRNVDDADVIKCMRLLTFLPLEEIDEMAKWEGSELNKAKEILAYQLTELVHGEEEAKKAQEGARALFSGADTSHMPTTELSEEDFDEEGKIDLITLLVKAELVPSRSEGRRAIQQGGVSIDGEKLTDIYHTVEKDAFAGDGIVLKRGKKKFKKICVK
ncbi:tyrosine--tRNA ligase [Blautia sp. KLE 1732]|nr:tyrosine--tRNA ligase [Blautia sp. KLE 1732]